MFFAIATLLTSPEFSIRGSHIAKVFSMPSYLYQVSMNAIAMFPVRSNQPTLIDEFHLIQVG
ncbi:MULTISPECIES: hypothetical protein [Tolypothrix]|uniref:Uncharacterized protein n=3 Tax=Nostocales TaxID=1161 RepID=A0A8S9T0P6_9CYAN|nr:hypothetical protein [Tolypothrix bouteillei]KAF3885142.1 hypothetical protein DA73_0400006430 [Tolypothrix bouteillei VB521301]